MKIALDTNVLAYAEGANGAAMRDKALELIQRLPAGLSCFQFRRWESCSTYSSEKPSGSQPGLGQIS
jgi:hypothetical protein